MIGVVKKFRTFDGRIIEGKILAVINHGVYLVVATPIICFVYNDGLFRFTDRNIVRN